MERKEIKHSPKLTTTITNTEKQIWNKVEDSYNRILSLAYHHCHLHIRKLPKWAAQGPGKTPEQPCDLL